MAEAKVRPKQPKEIAAHLRLRLREGWLIATVALCIYLSMSLFSFNPDDPGWSFTGTGQAVTNLGGVSGAWLADVLLFLFGYLAFIFPLVLAYQAFKLFRWRDSAAPFNWPMFLFRLTGLVLTIAAGAGLASMHFYAAGVGLREGSGGVLGMELMRLLDPAFSYVGATLMLLALFLFGITATTDLSWLSLMDATGRRVLAGLGYCRHTWHRYATWRTHRKAAKDTTENRRVALQKQRERDRARPAVKIEAPQPRKPQPSARVDRERQGNLFKVSTHDGLPALHLLDEADPNMTSGYSEKDLDGMSRLLELKLKDYNVDAAVIAAYPGPVITRFEVQPAAGVKVSKISGLVKDLARALAVTSVRVVEVIPGKSVIGIEIPNEDREIVHLHSVLKSPAYENSASPLSLALGHDIGGKPVVVDLQRMPHMLVAGTTGSGKSVGLNAMILSILFKAKPHEVRLIMVDPKMLELAVYEGIPHLLTPVVTDMKHAANALSWCVNEMEHRYRLMAALGVRNIGGFNRKVMDAERAGKPLMDPLWHRNELVDEEDEEPQALEFLPYIVVVIDEFADMMMLVGKKVEGLIARIAQKARASGIHLILATQRPSVDVITGLIKANIPTRIAFQVSSKIDSRTIMEQGGAEQLLGHGDMLYLPPGAAVPTRVHGAFVDDDEVHRVVESCRELGPPNYIDGILDSHSDGDVFGGIAANGRNDDDPEQDILYDEAVQFVTESRRASISAVQRKLRIGYNRAARMIETMEQAGVISEMNTNGSREVLANAPPTK